MALTDTSQIYAGRRMGQEEGGTKPGGGRELTVLIVILEFLVVVSKLLAIGAVAGAANLVLILASFEGPYLKAFLRIKGGKYKHLLSSVFAH